MSLRTVSGGGVVWCDQDGVEAVRTTLADPSGGKAACSAICDGHEFVPTVPDQEDFAVNAGVATRNGSKSIGRSTSVSNSVADKSSASKPVG